MGIEQKILVTGTSLRACVASALCASALLVACGQKGALFIPTDPEARERAIFPQVLLPDTRPDTPAPTPSQP
jgi:predicted small lipoprotein YifL